MPIKGIEVSYMTSVNWLSLIILFFPHWTGNLNKEQNLFLWNPTSRKETIKSDMLLILGIKRYICIYTHVYVYTNMNTNLYQIPAMNTYTFLHDFSYKIKTPICIKHQALSISLFPIKVLVPSNNYNKAFDYQEAVLGEDQ